MLQTEAERDTLWLQLMLVWLQVESAREAALKGPQSFPLERMLAVFWHLLRGADDSGGAGASDESQQASDVFMQITSLVSLRLLSRVRPYSRQARMCLLLHPEERA